MEKEIELDNLNDKSFIRFHTENGSINFLKELIQLNVINLDTGDEIDSIDVSKYKRENEAVNGETFEYGIDDELESLKFTFESIDTDVSLILARAF